jgi:hypothetical protein
MAITNPHPRTEDPVALIRERIKEKRIFEARFLFRQFSDEIAAHQKMRLADELAVTLSRAEQMLQRARAHAAGGERSQAEQVYREIEAIVIDMPGVAEEIKALAGASALITNKQPTAPIVVDPEPLFPEVAEREGAETQGTPPAVGPRKRRRPRWPLWLAAGCVVVMLSLLALWYDDVKDTSSPPITPEQPVHKILIRPMVAEGPATTEQAVPVQEPPPIAEVKAEKVLEPNTEQQSLPHPTDTPAPKPVQTVKAKSSPHPAVRLGTLQIEQSAKP